MDSKLGLIIRQISQSAGNQLDPAEFIANQLADVMATAGPAVPVRIAKDTLSGILGKAREGSISIVGVDQKGRDMTLVLSVETLAEMIAAALPKTSFYDELVSIGFKPAINAKPAERKVHPRIAPEIYRGDERKMAF